MTNMVEFTLSGEGTLQTQVYGSIKQAILARRISAGERLPSSRALAESLSVSRMTTVLAFERLTAEGYLESRKGAGTYVGSTIGFSTSPAKRNSSATVSKAVRTLIRAHNAIAQPPRENIQVDFRYSRINQASFPREAWSRSVRAAIREQWHEYPDPMGIESLRRTLQKYLLTRYGLRCSWEQIMIVGGSQQAIHLCAQILAENNDKVAMEDPGYAYATWVFRQYGLRILPLPVDRQGVKTDRLGRIRDFPRIIYVTPGHQFPLGGVLSMERRIELLSKAEKHDTWVIEDDYDSEYRHVGAPIPPLRVLDESERVIHMGTFSKTIDPGLRLGYLLLPQSLVEPFAITRRLNDQGSAILPQLALSHFIQSGEYERHVRRTRKAYRDSRGILVEALSRKLGDRARISGSETGSHLVLWLNGHPFSQSENIVRRFVEHGVYAQPLTPLYINPPAQAGLLIGYGSLTPDEIEQGVQYMDVALQTLQRE